MKRWIHASNINASSGAVQASTPTIDESKSDCQWMNGLYWDIDGHEMTITGVNGYPLLTCKVTETWVSEDTWEDRAHEEWYDIREDDNGHIFIQNKKNRDFRLYLNSAFNYMDLVPEEFDELDFLREDMNKNMPEDDIEEEYTPSASRGDYSPSNPWDAPGMSVKDFI